jgi:hypothetical protein
MVNNEKEIPKDRIKSATNSPKREGGGGGNRCPQ